MRGPPACASGRTLSRLVLALGVLLHVGCRAQTVKYTQLLAAQDNKRSKYTSGQFACGSAEGIAPGCWAGMGVDSGCEAVCTGMGADCVGYSKWSHKSFHGKFGCIVHTSADMPCPEMVDSLKGIMMGMGNLNFDGAHPGGM